MLVAALAARLAAGAEAADGPSPVVEAKRKVDAIESLLDAGKPKRAAGEFKAAASALESLLSQPKPPAGVRLLQDRLRKIRDSLELEGIDVDDLAVPVAKPAAKGRGKPGGMESAEKPDDQSGFTRPQTPRGPEVSFSTQIAPMLVRSCGGCHVQGRKGGFQMTSFEGLQKSGFLQPGNSQSSRLVEVIQSGDMPRGGGRVPPQELVSLMKWIDAGAPFDGKDPTAPLDALNAGVPGRAAVPQAAAMPAPPPPAAKPPAGGVSFAFEIAPVLLERCGSCHGGRRPAGRMSLETLAGPLKGGESGPAILPGKGSESLLVRKLTGTKIEGQRMPLGKSPLPDDLIAKIKKWIDEGAAIDVMDSSTPLETVAAAGRAAKLSHEKLRDIRFNAASKFWTRAIPDEAGTTARRDDVFVIGNLAEDEIAAVADQAQGMAERLRADLGVADGSPLMKGGCVVCACRKAYDYSGFWQTILAMERPREFTCHAGLVGDVLYGAFLMPKEGLAAEGDLASMLAEQMTTAAWLSRGAPDWFAVGAGRIAALRAAPKAARTLVLQKGGGMASLPSADAFLGRDIDPDDRAAVAYQFVSALAGRGDKLSQMARAMPAGATERGGFAAAFNKIFKASPEAAYRAWAGGSVAR